MFGENQRISHIQMQRQYQLVFFAPLLLFVSRKLQGWTGILSVLCTVPLVWLVLMWLKRKSGVYRKLQQYVGTVGVKIVVFFYQVFLVVAGVWIVAQASTLIMEYMIQGAPRWLVIGLFVLVSLAVGRAPEVRARFAEIAWPVVGGIVGIFFFFALWQGTKNWIAQGTLARNLEFDVVRAVSQISKSNEINGAFWNFSWSKLGKNVLTLLVFFSGTTLVPFIEVGQDKEDKKNAYLFRMVLGLAVWLCVVIVLQWMYFGANGIEALQYPLLDLMAGVQLPGNFVRRLDLIFLSVMLFALLFTMGSICFYSGFLWEKTNLSLGRLPVVALIFALVVTLSGCQIVEPEKRAYPLVIGIDWTGEEYEIYLAMAKLAQSTGQEKSGQEQEANMLVLKGKDTKEIQKMYDATEELYLDVGHVKALVISEKLLADNEKAMMILKDMEQNHDLGNSLYLFSVDDIEGLFKKNGTQIESLGDYLIGLYENRMEKQQPRRLRDAYYWIHNAQKMPKIPRLKVSEEKVELNN